MKHEIRGLVVSVVIVLIHHHTIQDGNIFGGTLCSSQAFIFESMMGGSLHNLEASLRRFVDRLSMLGDQGKTSEMMQDVSIITTLGDMLTPCFDTDAMLLWVKPTFQFVLNLQQRHCSNWKDVLVLTGAST